MNCIGMYGICRIPSTKKYFNLLFAQQQKLKSEGSFLDSFSLFTDIWNVQDYTALFVVRIWGFYFSPVNCNLFIVQLNNNSCNNDRLV